MNHAPTTPPANQAPQPLALRAVTLLIAVVVALSFLFGLGNVWALGLRLGVPGYIAPLVAPAVDLSVVALLVATRQLALTGATPSQIRPAQRLLIFCSLVTLALNTAQPILGGHYGRAAFDAVGCCLLIGWSHIAPDLLQGLQTGPIVHSPADLPAAHPISTPAVPGPQLEARTWGIGAQPVRAAPGGGQSGRQAGVSDPDLVRRARDEDAHHWETHHRPISAETLRKRLHIGTRTARDLVAQLRDDSRSRLTDRSSDPELLLTAG
ncbi:hypothetical protein I6A60_40360 [Frankia sp. AgB1.9]|uniref:hypothetical protein n=1 Tax=unclassified Frankia TaxID=2632575 RepID=UPI0019347073|nr:MULTISPECIES: hypothetical protein [unclassified Frankia]MBL7487978.1 hypothetical protein [Frankia sp. AgW1.1]MBL7554036.1 hypothetical protein [Frankia sp. AgB1.9]MBL7620892.1 hypothetical protein [Frankia sp. AgB1.8]